MTDATHHDLALMSKSRQAADALIAEEIAAMDVSVQADRLLLDEFQALRLTTPKPQEVQFSGGFGQICLRVTRPNGPYSVMYLPDAGYFSLCVESVIGPLDIGVHGPALRCFSSV